MPKVNLWSISFVKKYFKRTNKSLVVNDSETEEAQHSSLHPGVYYKNYSTADVSARQFFPVAICGIAEQSHGTPKSIFPIDLRTKINTCKVAVRTPT